MEKIESLLTIPGKENVIKYTACNILSGYSKQEKIIKNILEIAEFFLDIKSIHSTYEIYTDNSISETFWEMRRKLWKFKTEYYDKTKETIELETIMGVVEYFMLHNDELIITTRDNRLISSIIAHNYNKLNHEYMHFQLGKYSSDISIRYHYKNFYKFFSEIEGDLILSAHDRIYNKLSLQHFPQRVSGNIIFNSYNIKHFQYLPDIIYKNIIFNDCIINNINGWKSIIYGNVCLNMCGFKTKSEKEKTLEYLRSKLQIKGEIIINE